MPHLTDVYGRGQALGGYLGREWPEVCRAFIRATRRVLIASVVRGRGQGRDAGARSTRAPCADRRSYPLSEGVPEGGSACIGSPPTRAAPRVAEQDLYSAMCVEEEFCEVRLSAFSEARIAPVQES